MNTNWQRLYDAVFESWGLNDPMDRETALMESEDIEE